MITRRAFLAAAATTAAAAALPITRPTAAGAISLPASHAETWASRIRTSGGLVRTAHPFDYVAVRFDTQVAAAGFVRFVRPAGATTWQPFRLAEDLRDGELPGRTTTLVPAPADATAFELALPNGVHAATAVAIDTTRGPQRAVTERSIGTLVGRGLEGGRVPFRTRAGWGADESLRFDEDGTEIFPTQFFPIQTLTVHHTAIPAGDDPAANVRAIYYQHAVVQTWGDIGYHLLIDPNGVVYEGRYSGPDGVPVLDGTPVGDVARSVTAAHVGGFNSGNVGVALMADLTTELPTARALLSLAETLAVLSALGGLDPLGTTTYVNPITGVERTVRTISGHRDWLATECPGNAFYPTSSGSAHASPRSSAADAPRWAGFEARSARTSTASAGPSLVEVRVARSTSASGLGSRWLRCEWREAPEPRNQPTTGRR